MRARGRPVRARPICHSTLGFSTTKGAGLGRRFHLPGRAWGRSPVAEAFRHRIPATLGALSASCGEVLPASARCADQLSAGVPWWMPGPSRLWRSKWYLGLISQGGAYGAPACEAGTSGDSQVVPRAIAPAAKEDGT